MHDLLNERLIGARSEQGQERLSLPEVLAMLAEGQLHAYTGQRAHQADPWHVLTVQLAASVLARHPEVSAQAPPTERAFWRDGLLELAEGKASAWHLVVQDPTQPALLQHPLSNSQELESDFRPGQPKARTPDQLDVLVASKNHDLKGARAAAQDVETWLYALVLYQTTSGFLGQGNYGIVRMNSGSGSRAIISTVASLHPSRRFREELDRVCTMRQHVLSAALGYRERGVVLTWLTSWDRAAHQWHRSDLEPWFVEACRPLRLVETKGAIFALGATSQARQIGPKEPDGGDVGDPWTPINTDDQKKGRSALTVGAQGFTPSLLTALLFEQDYELTDLHKPSEGTGDLWFSASVLARGQGSTEGFHRIALPIPGHVRPRLSVLPSRRTLGQAASRLLNDAATLRNALYVALTVLAEGGPAQGDFKADSIKAWVKVVTQPLELRWRDAYFRHLWREADEAEETVVTEWREYLVSLGRDVLEGAAGRLPQPSNRRWRARVRARSAFVGTLRKRGWSFATESNVGENSA